MIIVPTLIPLFQNNRTDLPQTVRYLADNTTILADNTTNTTNNTSENITNNSSVTTDLNTNIVSRNWTIIFDNSTAFISINPNLSNISSEVCSTYSISYLSVYCTGKSFQTPNMNRTDIEDYLQTQIPQPSQIKKGLDHTFRKARIYGSMNITVYLTLA